MKLEWAVLARAARFDPTEGTDLAGVGFDTYWAMPGEGRHDLAFWIATCVKSDWYEFQRGGLQLGALITVTGPTGSILLEKHPGPITLKSPPNAMTFPGHDRRTVLPWLVQCVSSELGPHIVTFLLDGDPEPATLPLHIRLREGPA